MKRYDSYKPSGISWIGEIPSHWDELKAKYLFTRQNRPVRETDEVVTCFRDGQVTLRKNRRTTGFTESLQECGYQGIRKGDLVIHQMDAFAGSTGISDSDGKSTPVYIVCTPSQDFIYNPYYGYVIRNMGLNGYIQSLYRGIRERSSNFNFDVFSQQYLPIPPLDEQKQIVEFLSSKNALIETQKKDREHEIQLLKELKIAEIANVVLRGLNPNAPTKKAQTIQFGRIPAHWEERKIQYCFSERSQKGFPNEPMLCATQSQGVIPQSMYANRVVVVNKDFDKQKLVKVGDFVISLRSFEGGIEYAYYQGIISAAYTILTPKEVENSEYFKHLFKSFNFIQLLQTCVTGIREGQNINYPFLSKHFIPVPPIEEQEAIVEYIRKKNSAIDNMIANLRAEIDTLTEYKQRLIADVVTGQIDVRNL